MLGLTWQFRAGCIRVIALNLVLVSLAVIAPWGIGLGIDYLKFELIDGAKAPRWPLGLVPPQSWSPLTVLAVIAALVLGTALAKAVLTFYERMTMADLVARQIVVRLRSQVYDKMQRLSFRFFDAQESGSLINRVTGDVQSVRMFIEMVVVQSINVTIMFTVFAAYMFSQHVLLTLACLSPLPVVIWVVIRYSSVVKPAMMQNRRLLDDAVLKLSENLKGVHVVKGFSLQQEQIERFAEANRKVRDQKRWIFWQQSIYVPLINLLTHGNMVILLGYGGYLSASGQLPAGVGLVVFAALLNSLGDQVRAIANIANSMQQSLVGAQRVFEVLDAPLEISPPQTPITIEDSRGRVEFENVTFGYTPQEPVLRNVSFVVEPGECVAVLGATGSGKSTLLSLIPRFYDPTLGRVMIDNVDVRSLDIDELRRSIGLVFQESFLFSNTIESNIAFGHPEATHEQVENAARIAAAHNFVMETPKGYQTVLGEGGIGLSGGQRQRLAIARAVLLEPKILLLDDPTAAIDSETEDEILEAMESAMEGRTTFVVAHRLSTLRRADKVIVLDKGRIIQAGTHEQLMGAQGHYRRAARMQVGDDASRRALGMDGEVAS